MLRVTNRNSFTLNDRYDGIDYKFEPNKPVVIEEDAARHFFGYGLADKTPALVRQGWCISSDKTEEAYKKLNNFKFEQGSVEFKEEPALQVATGFDSAHVQTLESKLKPSGKSSARPATA